MIKTNGKGRGDMIFQIALVLLLCEVGISIEAVEMNWERSPPSASTAGTLCFILFQPPYNLTLVKMRKKTICTKFLTFVSFNIESKSKILSNDTFTILAQFQRMTF